MEVLQASNEKMGQFWCNGCKQSSKLWYDHLKMALERVGFVMNEMDQCVFNIVRNGVQVSIGFHVDDLLCTCVDDECLEWVSEILRQEFKEITVEKASKLCYLGMSVIIEPTWCG